MGLLDRLFRSAEKTEEASNQNEETQQSSRSQRQEFVDSLKVDVDYTPQSQPTGSTQTTSQDDGYERGDDLTHTRSDSLKVGNAEQEASPQAEQPQDAPVPAPAETESTQDTAEDSVESVGDGEEDGEEDGLGL